MSKNNDEENNVHCLLLSRSYSTLLIYVNPIPMRV